MREGPQVILALSFMLAIGFLLSILSCVLWSNYLPLFVILSFLLARVPHALHNNTQDTDANFATGFIVVSGIAMPVIFAHAGLITTGAMVMSVSGGLLIYGTIITFFRKTDDDDF